MRRFIVCAECNTPYTGYIKNKKLKNGTIAQFYYYKCNRIGCKNNKSSKAVHKDFRNILEGLQINPLFVDLIKKELERKYYEIIEDDATTSKALKAQVTELQTKLEKLEERFGFGEIERDLYEKLSSKVRTEIVGKEKELKKVEIKIIEPGQIDRKSRCNLLKISFFMEKWRLKKQENSARNLLSRRIVL